MHSEFFASRYYERIVDRSVEVCISFDYSELISEDTVSCFPEYMCMLECNGGDETSERMVEDICTIVGSS
jgi:hypothetical protein